MSSARVFLIVRAPNGDVREVPIGGTAVVLGRDDSADVRVEDKKVSRRHASFRLVDGEPWVEDLGSQNGVKLNGKRINKRAKFGPKDKVKVGGYEVTLRESDGADSVSVRADTSNTPFRDPSPLEVTGDDTDDPASHSGPDETPDGHLAPALEALDDPVKGQRFILHRGENIIGRLEDCDVPVLDGSVSRQHVRVVFARDRLSISDLGSSNGTFVNEMRVEMAELSDGDILRVGNIRFHVVLPELPEGAGDGALDTGISAISSARRSWTAPVIVALLAAIGVLSGAVYWRWSMKARADAVVLSPVSRDAGPTVLAEVPSGPADAGEVERTIEPVKPEDLSQAARAASRVPPGRADAGKTAEAPRDAAQSTPAPPSPSEAQAEGDDPDAGAQRAEDVPAAPEEEPEAETAQVVAASATVTAARTSTSPYGPRDQLGLPLDLPPVDESFDFDAFVTEKLASAQAIEATGDLAKLKGVITELLERDPINGEGKAVLARISAREGAGETIKKAEKLIEKGEWARGLRIYASVPEETREGAVARARVEELRTKALEQELSRADQEQKERKGWIRAHRRYADVLELDPSSERARAGVRGVERKMRAKGVRFSAYVPGGGSAGPEGRTRARAPDPERDDGKMDAAIAEFHAGEVEPARIAQLYARGSMQSAVKRAEAAEKTSAGADREAIKQIRERLKTIAALYERVRNETSNDPSAAWARLLELQRVEELILPKTVRSMVRKDLEESLAAAFAALGASLLERDRPEEAFERWNAGFKLDPGNPAILAGLNKLEERAKTLLDEAEVAAQRGERDVCARLRSISRITRGTSEVHRRALERARQVCG